MQNPLNPNAQKLNLQRFPVQKKQTLQAWDAADYYVLEYLQEQKTKLENSKILIFNDGFGALTCCLADFKPTLITDSYLAQLATKNNLKNNKLNSEDVVFLDSLCTAKQKFDIILIKVPKSLDFLFDFFTRLKQNIDENTKIILAGMVKNIPKTLWKALENKIGTTNTSLAKKKAKLIFLKTDIDKLNRLQSAYPKVYTQADTELKIYNHANVFSKQSIDIGTRFLLKNLPQLESIYRIIDLGCGNGILGLNCTKRYQNASVHFVDESFMAVESARLTLQNNGVDTSLHKFSVTNCLDGFASESVDLIVCNPPFHQVHAIGTQIALQMFRQSYKTLKTGGFFIVVANRHLPYFSPLKKLFKNVRTLASNQKFLIFLMKK